MTAELIPYKLIFKNPSGTSRGVLTTKETWFIRIKDGERNGIGECGMVRGLSVDDRPDFEKKLSEICQKINNGFDALKQELAEFPSILFGLEMAFKSLESEDSYTLFPSDFTEGRDSIDINGLIWMGEKSFMKQQIIEKIESGFNCIKLKIGALEFDQELDLLKYIRQELSSDKIELRVDANGAFKPEEALEKLKRLSNYSLHSIEQPIKPQQWQEMAELCEFSPLPIALDEELIGVFSETKKEELLQTIRPQYIIMKPTLLGGFEKSEEWISISNDLNIEWWITSALESNVGLNAIAQWTYILDNKMPQGLGTGGLFTNNFESPLFVKNGTLRSDKNKGWNFNI